MSWKHEAHKKPNMKILLALLFIPYLSDMVRVASEPKIDGYCNDSDDLPYLVMTH